MKEDLIPYLCLDVESVRKGQGEFHLLVKRHKDMLKGFPFLGDFDEIIGKNQDLYSVNL